jgi:arsenite methyltransferase
LGIDISEPMLTRAVRAEAGTQVGFLRADAQRLPLRDETVDAVLSIAMPQLIPDPVAAVAGMARVLRSGGRLAAVVPTAGRTARFWRLLSNIGAHV